MSYRLILQNPSLPCLTPAFLCIPPDKQTVSLILHDAACSRSARIPASVRFLHLRLHEGLGADGRGGAGHLAQGHVWRWRMHVDCNGKRGGCSVVHLTKHVSFAETWIIFAVNPVVFFGPRRAAWVQHSSADRLLQLNLRSGTNCSNYSLEFIAL